LKKINRFISVINKKEGASCITTHLPNEYLTFIDKRNKKQEHEGISMCNLLYHQLFLSGFNVSEKNDTGYP